MPDKDEGSVPGTLRFSIDVNSLPFSANGVERQVISRRPSGKIVPGMGAVGRVEEDENEVGDRTNRYCRVSRGIRD